MKKIAFLSNDLARGGMQRVVVIIANKFIELGYDVSVVLIHGHVANEYNDCKANIIDITDGEYKTSLSMAFRLKNLLADFDAIIINYYFGESNLFSTCISICYIYFPNKIIVVNHNNNHMIHLTADKKLSHYVNSNICNVVSICYAMQEDMNKEYCFSNTKTIFNPIVINQIQSMMNDATDENINCKYILAVGRLDYQKNFPALIRAYGKSSLPKNNIKLVIVGQSFSSLTVEYKAAIEDAKKLGVESEILWLGLKDNPFKYMKNALFMVMSSRFEGFGMVLTECLATGTPVISYDLKTGPNEIIVHEHNGLLVKNQDEDELTKAIDRLYFDKELYNKCKSNSISSVQKFDIDNIIKNWEVLIDEVAEVNTTNTTKLKVHEPDYVNPHGTFSTKELLEYINHALNYWTILDYINNIATDASIIKFFEDNIYNLIDKYCFIFKCSNDLKKAIQVDVSLNITNALTSSNLSHNYRSNLLSKLTITKNIQKENEIFIYLLSMKNNHINWLNYKIDNLENNRWYKFGKSSKRGKVIKILKFTISKFIPTNSIGYDLLKITYKTAKLVYKFCQNIKIFKLLLKKRG